MSEPTPITDLRNPGRTIHAGVILLGGTTEILDVAPIDYLHALTKEFLGEWLEEMLPTDLKQQAIDLKCHWVNQTGTAASLTAGITLTPTNTFETCPPLDIALMGAHNMAYQPTPEELAFIRKTYESCHSFLTICGGMMGPLTAGNQNGHRATAPRQMLAMLKQQAPDVEWVDQRYVHDGKLWSSGALLNGTDMMAEFGRQNFGAKNGEEEKLADLTVSAAGWPVRGVEYRDGEGYELARQRAVVA